MLLLRCIFCVTLVASVLVLAAAYNAGSNFQTTSLFASISKADGSLWIWGSSAVGGVGGTGVSGIRSVASNNYAFAAIKTDGTVVAFGDIEGGGILYPRSLVDSLVGVTDIITTYSAFCAVKTDHTVVAWGGL